MLQKILVPIDFSEASSAALHEACGLARPADAELLLLHVDEFPARAANELPYLPEHVVVEHAEAVSKHLAQAVTDAEARGCRVRTRVLAGSVHHGIMSTLAEEKPDLVVMGSHGRRGVHRLMLGSVAERVVRASTIPVLTVRPVVPARAASSA